jgi:hypothetical protein
MSTNPSVPDRAAYIQRFYDEIQEMATRVRRAANVLGKEGSEDWQQYVIDSGEVLNLLHDTMRASSALLARIRQKATQHAERLEAKEDEGEKP